MTALEIYTAPDGGRLTFGDEHHRLISDTIAPGASPAEVDVFLMVCAHVQLDPLRSQIWLVPRWDNKARREVFKPQTSIDGLRLIAQRTGLYAGTSPVEWCGTDGQWRDVWLDATPPAAARVSVSRKDWERPASGVVMWHEFVQTKKDGKPTHMWAEKGAHMLGKCAEAQALRKAFPAETSGLYTDDEHPADMVEAVRDVAVIEQADPERDAVAAAFAEFLPLVPKLGDIDAFKDTVRVMAAGAGLGDIDKFTPAALTPAQAEMMLDHARAIAGGQIPPAVAAPEADPLADYCAAHDVDPPLLETVAAHLGSTLDEAAAHVAEWAGA